MFFFFLKEAIEVDCSKQILDLVFWHKISKRPCPNWKQFLYRLFKRVLYILNKTLLVLKAKIFRWISSRTLIYGIQKRAVLLKHAFLASALNFAASTSYFDSLAEAAGSGLHTMGLEFKKSANWKKTTEQKFQNVSVKMNRFLFSNWIIRNTKYIFFMKSEALLKLETEWIQVKLKLHQIKVHSFSIFRPLRYAWRREVGQTCPDFDRPRVLQRPGTWKQLTLFIIMSTKFSKFTK